MIVLDTNVISEPLKSRPDMGVVAWLTDVSANCDVRITSITLAELLDGVHQLPSGKRKTELENSIQSIVTSYEEKLILSFDQLAASRYPHAAFGRRKLGLNVEHSDTQIAAICLAHHAVLATRNERHFLATGVTTVNPWDQSQL